MALVRRASRSGGSTNLENVFRGWYPQFSRPGRFSPDLLTLSHYVAGRSCRAVASLSAVGPIPLATADVKHHLLIVKRGMSSKPELESAEARIQATLGDEQAGRFAGRLDLSGLALTDLPKSLGKLRGLQTLDLSRNQIRSLPEWLGKLRGLQTLDLSDNQIRSLPEWLGKLSGLQILSLAYNQLRSLPEWLGKLSGLQTLNLSGNQLTRLPESLGKLSGLQELYLMGNQIRIPSEWLGKLSGLQGLYLSDNQLTRLPESLGKLRGLQTLYLFGSQLTSLPEWLGKLRGLQTLYLSDNQIRSLPESLGKLRGLQALYLSGNQLTSLPESLGKLSGLQRLDLSGNQIRSLPEWLGKLSGLQMLDLSGNQLNTLPKAVQRLKRLEKLFLHDNSGLDLPDEVLGPTSSEVSGSRNKSPKLPREILDYYFATRGRKGRALREVKLIVVGRGGAGKTSLIKRLKGEPFDPDEMETHGINIRELELVCADGPVRARVWDFGGQHVLHAMHEFFLTARSLYLLVLVEREEMAERDAVYWLQLIRSYAGRARVVVALNKSGGHAGEMARRTLEEKYGPIVAWVPTECSEPDSEKSGIDSLIAALTRATDAMEDVRRRFPAKWFQIKNWLGGMKDSYLSYEAYSAQCASWARRTLRNKRSWPHGSTTWVLRSITGVIPVFAILRCFGQTGSPMAFTPSCARTTHATISRLRGRGSSRLSVLVRFTRLPKGWEC